jgi:hypothetical protein
MSPAGNVVPSLCDAYVYGRAVFIEDCTVLQLCRYLHSQENLKMRLS